MSGSMAYFLNEDKLGTRFNFYSCQTMVDSHVKNNTNNIIHWAMTFPLKQPVILDKITPFRMNEQ